MDLSPPFPMKKSKTHRATGSESTRKKKFVPPLKDLKGKVALKVLTSPIPNRVNDFNLDTLIDSSLVTGVSVSVDHVMFPPWKIRRVKLLCRSRPTQFPIALLISTLILDDARPKRRPLQSI